MYTSLICGCLFTINKTHNGDRLILTTACIKAITPKLLHVYMCVYVTFHQIIPWEKQLQGIRFYISDFLHKGSIYVFVKNGLHYNNWLTSVINILGCINKNLELCENFYLRISASKIKIMKICGGEFETAFGFVPIGMEWSMSKSVRWIANQYETVSRIVSKWHIYMLHYDTLWQVFQRSMISVSYVLGKC